MYEKIGMLYLFYFLSLVNALNIIVKSSTTIPSGKQVNSRIKEIKYNKHIISLSFWHISKTSHRIFSKLLGKTTKLFAKSF